MCTLFTQAGVSRNSDMFNVITEGLIEKVIVSGRARHSGQYMCQACNELGCSTTNNKSSIVTIFVTGMLVRFDISRPEHTMLT